MRSIAYCISNTFQTVLCATRSRDLDLFYTILVDVTVVVKKILSSHKAAAIGSMLFLEHYFGLY